MVKNAVIPAYRAPQNLKNFVTWRYLVDFVADSSSRGSAGSIRLRQGYGATGLKPASQTVNNNVRCRKAHIAFPAGQVCDIVANWTPHSRGVTILWNPDTVTPLAPQPKLNTIFYRWSEKVQVKPICIPWGNATRNLLGVFLR